MLRKCQAFRRMPSWKWGWTKSRKPYANHSEIWNHDDCTRAIGGWPCTCAGNADAPARAASSDEHFSGKAGISTDGKISGKCEGFTDYARASPEDRHRIKSYTAAGGGRDSRRQGKAAAVGTVPQSNGGLYGG